MSGTATRWMTLAICAVFLGAGGSAGAIDADEAIGFERTPPRLGFIDGEVSFLRLGADDWTPALVNTALASGDELYTAEAANLELQVAARAYVRAGENTQLGIASLEPDYLQLRVTNGTVSLDLRSLQAGQTFEIDTPNAAFTVERTGYYRVEVDGGTTSFVSRRGGRATLTPATGKSVVISASEQVVVSGDEAPQIESYAAPELDAWDRWNYARTDEQLDAVSARYVPADVYGANDLDHHGDWRVVPAYGPIWVPRGVPVGWAPYSTGRWLWDPYYGWTWVDDASWGWAPYHYGRWVRVSGYWGWAPGPIVARPYYAPALVAFYGGGGFSIGVGIGSSPSVGWVALGWGEPLVPWWGPSNFRAYPRWAGWGGPRYVNKVVVKNKTVIKVKEINVYQNAHERNAFITVDRQDFGRRDRGKAQYKRGKPDGFRPAHGDFSVRPDRSSLVAESGSARHRPSDTWRRPVVATRQPHRDPKPDFEPRRSSAKPAADSTQRKPVAAQDTDPPVRVAPREGKRVKASTRPPFAKRGDGERAMPPPAPRFERSARGEAKPDAPRAGARRPQGNATPERPVTPKTGGNVRSEPTPPERSAVRPKAAPQGRSESVDRATPHQRNLPGEPANRVFRRRQKQSEPEARKQSPAPETRSDPRTQKNGTPRSVNESPATGSGAGHGGRSKGQSRGH